MPFARESSTRSLLTRAEIGVLLVHQCIDLGTNSRLGLHLTNKFLLACAETGILLVHQCRDLGNNSSLGFYLSSKLVDKLLLEFNWGIVRRNHPLYLISLSVKGVDNASLFAELLL